MAIACILSIVLSACGSSTTSPAPSASPLASVGVAISQSPSSAPAPSCPPVASASSVPAATTLWWRDRVFYEIFVRSFADSDGDGIGDLRGLISKLDYLNDGDPATTDDLGVTGLWLMPIAASPSYHGYDVTNYKAIEADYGTAEDFKALMAAAHERGIEVVVDLVLNHTSIDHPWFGDSRTPGSAHDDWYVWSDTQPTVSGSGGSPVWHKDGNRWYYAYFWEGMPDLNLRNPDVTAALDDVARYWLEDLGVDGFRLDAARHLIEDGDQLQNTPETFAWLEGFRSRVRAVKPDAMLVGEVWDATSTSSKYVRDGALDMAFEFGLASATLTGVRESDPGTIAAIQAEVQAAYPPGGYATFLTNHDQDRSFDVLARDLPSARQAATLLLTGSGVPFVYYGEELGMRGRKPDERIRTPFAWDGSAPGYGFTSGTPWEAMADGVAIANVASQTGDQASLLSTYRALIALRAAHPALRIGAFTAMRASDRGVYAYLRQDGADTVAVVMNLGDTEVTGLSLTLAAGELCGTPAIRVLSGGDTSGSGTTEVPAPTVNAHGGFDTWAIGTLAPRQTLILVVGP